MVKSLQKVIWTKKAQSDLHEIYDYMKKDSEDRAIKLIDAIVKKVDILEQGFFGAGQREEILRHLKKEYRRLIEGNYKIVYHISKDKVYINSIFYARQNPRKLKVK